MGNIPVNQQGIPSNATSTTSSSSATPNKAVIAQSTAGTILSHIMPQTIEVRIQNERAQMESDLAIVSAQVEKAMAEIDRVTHRIRCAIADHRRTKRPALYRSQMLIEYQSAVKNYELALERQKIVFTNQKRFENDIMTREFLRKNERFYRAMRDIQRKDPVDIETLEDEMQETNEAGLEAARGYRSFSERIMMGNEQIADAMEPMYSTSSSSESALWAEFEREFDMNEGDAMQAPSPFQVNTMPSTYATPVPNHDLAPPLPPPSTRTPLDTHVEPRVPVAVALSTTTGSTETSTQFEAL